MGWPCGTVYGHAGRAGASLATDIPEHSAERVAKLGGGLRPSAGEDVERALKLSEATRSSLVDSDAVLELRPLRGHTQAIEAFAALEHTLERGHVSFEES